MQKGDRMKQERIDPGWEWTRKFNISPGVKVGDTVYLSGIVAFDNEGNVVGEGDVYEQSKYIFKNIEEALASAGASMADIVKITTYLTDISRYPEFGKARTEAFPNGVPSSTAVTSPALVMPELLVEVEAVAIIGSGAN
jgi:2-iminobutanoate/2-iminopropanoate deaminase